MNTKTTAILLILVILAAGYVVIFHRDWLRQEEEERGVKLPTIVSERLIRNVGKVEKVILERPGKEKIVFQRHGTEWQIVEPVKATAVDWRVDSIVSKIKNLRYVRKYAPDDPDRPTDTITHLSPPEHIVTLINDEGKKFCVKVGLPVPLQQDRTYVQLGDDKHIYVADVDLTSPLSLTLSDYREKALMRFDKDKAVRVKIQGSENYELAKINGKWSIVSPVSARANADKVDTLLGSIRDIMVEKFVNDNPTDLAQFGLDKPHLVITVELAAPKPTTTTTSTKPTTKPAKPQKGKVLSIAFGLTVNDSVFAKLTDKPWVFEVAKFRLDGLKTKLSDIRDKHVLDIPEDAKITKIDIHLSAGGSSKLIKQGEDWRMTHPFEGKCDNKAVEHLISTLRELQAKDFQDNPTMLEAFGLEPPKGKITLYLQAGGKVISLLIGNTSRSGQMGFVKATDSNSVAIISATDYAKLIKPSAAYWQKTIFKLPEDATPVKIALEREDGKFIVSGLDNEEYKLISPIKAKADEQNVRTMLEAVKNIEAEKIVVLNTRLPEKFAKSKGINVKLTYRLNATEKPATKPSATTKPTTTTTATRPTSAPTAKPKTVEKTVSIKVMKDKIASFVWLTDTTPKVVGKMDRTFYDKFAAEMRDRRILDIQADKIVSFKLTIQKTTLEFIRTGKNWRYTADVFVTIDNEKVEDFLNDLSEIKAKRFVDYSNRPNLKRFGLDNPAMTLEMKDRDGKVIRLCIARTGPVGTDDLYAISSQVPGVFIIGTETSKNVQKSLKDFQKK